MTRKNPAVIITKRLSIVDIVLRRSQLGRVVRITKVLICPVFNCLCFVYCEIIQTQN